MVDAKFAGEEFGSTREVDSSQQSALVYWRRKITIHTDAQTRMNLKQIQYIYVYLRNKTYRTTMSSSEGSKIS